MKTDKSAENEQRTLLAAAYPIQALKGWLSKHVDVPPGRQGIALFRSGKYELFSSGENRVITDLDRYKGLGAGFWAGYLPKEPFKATLTITNLLSGDDVLLDLSLLCTLEVHDPVRFFTEVVITRREIPAGSFVIGEAELFTAFANLVRKYAAQDLVDGNLDRDLVQKAFLVINPSLQDQGLSLETIDLVTCWRQEDRLAIEQHIFQLEQKMTDLQFEKKLAEAEDQNELNAFLEANGVDLPTPMRVVKSAQGEGQENAGNIYKTWVGTQTEGQKPGRNFRLKSLLIKQTLDDANRKKRSAYKPRWWLPRTVWIIVVLAAAIGLTIFLNHASKTLEWAGRSEFYIAIWLFALGALLESAKALFKEWEKLFATDIDTVDMIGLDQLRIKDRQVIDRIVREQCQLELGIQRETLNELRSRVFHAGETDLALKMRQIEQKIEDFIAKTKDDNFGAAPYLRSDIRISEKTWLTFMDSEEILLIQAALLTENVHSLQVMFAHSQLNLDPVLEFEVDLDAFVKSFSVRGRILHTNELDQA
jgi:hypothetical protein